MEVKFAIKICDLHLNLPNIHYENRAHAVKQGCPVFTAFDAANI
jgi:hypothetical protein